MRRVIGGRRGIGWGYGIMVWAYFNRCRLLVTAAEVGRGSVGVGGTESKICGACSHADTGGCSDGAPRSSGVPLTLFLLIILFVLIPLIFS